MAGTKNRSWHSLRMEGHALEGGVLYTLKAEATAVCRAGPLMLSRRTQVAIRNTTCNPDNGGLGDRVETILSRRNCLSHTHHPRDIPRQSRLRTPSIRGVIRESGLLNKVGLDSKPMGTWNTASLLTRGCFYCAHPCSLSSNQKIMQVPNVTEHGGCVEC